jgi:hypothetical protein
MSAYAGVRSSRLLLVSNVPGGRDPHGGRWRTSAIEPPSESRRGAPVRSKSIRRTVLPRRGGCKRFRRTTERLTRFVEREHPTAVKPFDPMNALVARNTAANTAAMATELNKVISKLREAGIQLHGLFKWRMTCEPYWNPVGFDFMCDDWQRLHDAAAKRSRLGFDIIDMPATIRGSELEARASASLISASRRSFISTSR